MIRKYFNALGTMIIEKVKTVKYNTTKEIFNLRQKVEEKL